MLRSIVQGADFCGQVTTTDKKEVVTLKPDGWCYAYVGLLVFFAFARLTYALRRPFHAYEVAKVLSMLALCGVMHAHCARCNAFRGFLKVLCIQVVCELVLDLVFWPRKV